MRGLYRAIEGIQNNRMVWREVRHEQIAGVYFVRYEHHYLFFRELADGRLGIISVLHKRMDLPNRLREDQHDAKET